MSQVSLLVAYIYCKGSQRVDEIYLLAAAGSGSGCPRCQVPSILPWPPLISQMVAQHWPTTCEGNYHRLLIQDLVLPHGDVFNVPGKVSQSQPDLSNLQFN